MIHPLLRLVVTQPNLLADHAEAYAGLVGEELARTTRSLTLRLVLGVVALVLVGVTAVLAGVALMLWAVLPASSIQAPWALVVGPGVPLVAAVVCALVAKQKSPDAFATLKQQVAADLVMLREVSVAA
ncbi:MAG: hypothetical protein M3O01_03960 [Pseudomonadota bacterium]|nr:hypothetical protein [Pseudomonadota bacterium]